ncbi:hypothetical protein ACNFBT_10940 [Pseudomonas sp. NY15181]|uniref:hypothetical protein n=1 Tax=Pseudomonas TaxID=286 RepID=UPI00351D250E
MHLITDRPGPISYVHPNGAQAIIAFEWGAVVDSVPQEVLVRVSGQIVCADSGPWKNFADARCQAIAMATRWCERHPI